VIQCDALDLLSGLKSNSVDIVFLDPPFNLGKQYGTRSAQADSRETAEYLSFMTQVLKLSIAALKPGGALYLYHIPLWAMQLAPFLHRKMTFRHWIAISMKNGFVRGKSLHPAHYALLYFTKGEPAVFSRPKILPARCRHCNGYVKDYGGYARYVEDGINLGDVWDDLSPVRHSKYKNRSANELPITLPRRVVAISGEPGGIFVDPFAGTGTSLVAAQERGMYFLASDYEESNCQLMVERVQSAAACEAHTAELPVVVV
jgi:site-specific DNA-methyltransferase (adenine-specific)